MRRSLHRLTLAAATACALGGLTALAPPAGASLGLIQGKWFNPADGSTVSGLATLQFTNPNNGYVVFRTPNGTLLGPPQATSTVVPAAWSTVSLPNGPATVTAQECLSEVNCDPLLSRTFTVSNPQVSFSPAPGGTLASPVVHIGGSSSIVQSGALSTATSYDVTYLVGTLSRTLSGVSLPYDLKLSGLNLPTATYGVDVMVTPHCGNDCDKGAFSAHYTAKLTDTAKPVVKQLSIAKSFKTRSHGVPSASVTTDEKVTAKLLVYKKNKLVSTGPATSVKAGHKTTVKGKAGLKAGTYTVALSLKDASGNTTTTAKKTVVGT